MKKPVEKMMSAAGNRPPLHGLVLAGGRSLRMGEDKGNIAWHGKPQRLYVADVLANLCADVYISCRAEQENEIPYPYKSLKDTVDAGGPVVGILSAFARFPDVAWLVVACDLPLLNPDTLENLVHQRAPEMNVTAYRSPTDGLPEPLIAIWEPSSRPLLVDYLKFLVSISSAILLIDSHNPNALMNANTPADKENAYKHLRNP